MENLNTITDRVKYIKSLPQKTKEGVCAYTYYVGGDINGVYYETDKYVIVAAACGPKAEIYGILLEKKKFLFCINYTRMISWGGNLEKYKQKIADYEEWDKAVKNN